MFFHIYAYIYLQNGNYIDPPVLDFIRLFFEFNSFLEDLDISLKVALEL